MQKELELKEIQQETLGLLRKIIQICDEIHINYFVAYGTLIGAARHKGYIPWDDDFDIWMTRPEFDKFVDYCKTNAAALLPYKLFDFENSPGYPYGIPRFCDTRFRMETAAHNVSLGLFIDVYPLDGLGKNISRAKRKILPRENLWKKCCRFQRAKKYYKSAHLLVNIPNYLVYLFSYLFPMAFYLKKLKNLSKMYSFEDSDYVECYTWEEPFCPKPKECFMDYEYLEFEGIKVKAPKNYDKLLRDIYGDYMVMPPVEQRKPAHNYKIYRNV